MEHRTPEWEDPQCFEGHLNEKQLAELEKQDAKRDVRTALMLSQLSQAVDFSIGWTKLLVLNVRSLEKENEELRKTSETQGARILQLEDRFRAVMWLAGTVIGAVLIETVRRWYR